MSQNVVYNGVTYTIPTVGEVNWGQQVTKYLVALSNGSLTLAGGSFPLTNQVNFGPTFGLTVSNLTSTSANPATAGLLRLTNLDTIQWRNAANSGNLVLGVDTSNNLTYNGIPLVNNTAPTFTGPVNITGILNVTGNGTFGGSVTATNFIGPGTGLTGTASALSIGGNAATATLASTVTTNANLTGPVTSVGNATTITPTGVSPGTYGSGVTSAQVTVGADGRVTSVTAIPISTSGVGTVTHITGDLTNSAVILGNSSGDIRPMPSLGTTSTVLKGNAAGDPTWGQVNLSTDVTGNLSVNNLNSGTNASATTFWSGDGTWKAAGLSTGISQTSAVDLSFTASGPYIRDLTTTTLGKSVILPNATTLSVLAPRYVLRNAGTFPFGIRDVTQRLLTAVEPGGVVTLTLLDNSTASGIWQYEGTNLSPGLITIDQTLATGITPAMVSYAANVQVDANTSIHFVNNSNNAGFSAIIVDNGGKVINGPFLISSTSNARVCAAFSVTATRFIVFWGVANSQTATTFDIKGGSPSRTITVVNTATNNTDPLINNVATISPWSGEDSIGAPKIQQMSAFKYTIAAMSNAGVQSLMYVVDVNTGTGAVTIGAGLAIPSANPAAEVTNWQLTATTGVVIYGTSSGSQQPFAVVYTISGTTTIAYGTSVGTGMQTSEARAISSQRTSSTSVWMVSNNNNTTGALVRQMTFSGTTISLSGIASVLPATNGVTMNFTSQGFNRWNSRITATGANTVQVKWHRNNLVPNGGVIANFTASAGPNISINAQTTGGYTNSDTGVGWILGSSATDTLALSLVTTQSPAFLSSYVPIKSSVINSIPQGIGHNSTIGIGAFGNDPVVSSVRLSGGDYLISQVNVINPGIEVVRTNGDAINYRGIIALPTLLVNTFVNGDTELTNKQWLTTPFSNRVVLVTGDPANTSTTSPVLSQTVATQRVLNIEIAI